ncbi:MAG: SLBB domain-containing protein [Pyrinomonadaceae bacterium]
MRISFAVLALAALCFAAGARAQAPANEEQKGYLIGPGDEITGKVLGEPQFDFVATVDEDGRIEVPFFDEPVSAKCKTERDLRVEVTRLLSKYLKSPQLSLRVTQRNSRPPVSVYGEVRQPQQFNLTRRVRLIEVISASGGVTEKSGGMVQVFRTRQPMCGETTVEAVWRPADAGDSFDTPSRIFSLASLRQGLEEANPEILPGDIVVVPKAAPVYVVGEVIKPGEIDLPEGGLPLTQAVAMASGFSREAKTKTLKVYRRKPGATQPEVIVANFDAIKKGQEKDLMLEPFDIVEVGKAKKSFGDILMETLTGLPARVPIRPL